MLFPILYTMAMQGYYLGMRIASPFHPKAKLFINGRTHLANDLEPLNVQNKPVIWFHCASVGEFEQALPLIDAIQNDFPAYQTLVSFFSPSGYQFAKKRYPSLNICYLPFDTPSACEYFIRKVRPHLAIFIKYEFWYNILRACHRAQVPLFLVDGIFRSNQAFFKPYGNLFKPLLNPFTHFFLQNESSAQLLSQLGYSNHSVTGDTRFDRVLSISQKPFHIPILEQVCPKPGSAFVAGSVWDTDIPVLTEIIQELPKNMPIILAPHQPGHFNTAWIKEPFTLYSQFKENNTARILILDTLGHLSSSYRLARFAYVGGGFGKGLHNILEATIYGTPVLIGPQFQKFQEAVDLVELAAAFPISPENAAEKTRLVLGKGESISKTLSHYFETRTNVSDKILVFLKRGKFL